MKKMFKKQKTEEKVTKNVKKFQKNYQIAATSDLSVKHLLKNVRQKKILKKYRCRLAIRSKYVN